MRNLKKFVGAVAVALLFAGCADSAQPVGPNALRSRGANSATTAVATDTATSSGTTVSATPTPLTFLPEAPRLRSYDTTFQAHQGWKQSFVIFHQDGNYFMVLDVPTSAQFVDADGNPVPDGAPVDIRTRVDSTFITFEFGPHGSYFTGSRPVMLWVYLKYVDLGSGSSLPAIWYQADATEPWTRLSTTADKAGNWLKVELRHFSNYRVAF